MLNPNRVIDGKKEREYEKDKKESRSGIQSQDGYSCTSRVTSHLLS